MNKSEKKRNPCPSGASDSMSRISMDDDDGDCDGGDDDGSVYLLYAREKY